MNVGGEQRLLRLKYVFVERPDGTTALRVGRGKFVQHAELVQASESVIGAGRLQLSYLDESAPERKILFTGDSQGFPTKEDFVVGDQSYHPIAARSGLARIEELLRELVGEELAIEREAPLPSEPPPPPPAPKPPLLIDLVGGQPPPVSMPLPREFTLRFQSTRKRGMVEELHRVTTADFLRQLVKWQMTFAFCKGTDGNALYLVERMGSRAVYGNNHNTIHEGRELLRQSFGDLGDALAEKGYIKAAGNGLYLLSELTTLFQGDAGAVSELLRFFEGMGITVRINKSS